MKQYMTTIFFLTIGFLLLVGNAAGATEEAKLNANDGETSDYFGYSVAMDGDTAVIGAYRDTYDAGSDFGSVYVFTRSGGTWTQQAKLNATDGATNDFFGISVAVDGDTVVIGAYHDDDRGTDSGSVYVFTRSGTTWTQQAKLNASDGAAGDMFGYSVSVDGDTVVIGAWGDDYGAGTDSGSAYVFTRSGTTWMQQAKLNANDVAAYNAYFGYSVLVDGDTAVIGAPYDYGSYSGSAYVFTRNGATWTQQAKLNATDGAGFDNFGISVAVNGDTAVIGAYLDDDLGGQSGSAYVFARSGATWTQQAKLNANDGAVGDRFGYSVSVDGDTVVISAHRDDDRGTDSGSAYVFTRSGGTWTQQAKLNASDGAAEDDFGYSVSVDGDAVVIGAPNDDDKGINSGSAYVYSLGSTDGNAPVAFDDSYSVDEDSILNVNESGILSNDTDLEGDTLNAVLVDSTTNGILALNANGSFRYTPNPDFNGADGFTYEANDGYDNSNIATVSITINPVNDAPVAFDDSYSVNENIVLNVIAPGVLGNDNDLEGDTLNAVLVGSTTNGILALNANGSFSYTPNSDFNGADSFTYKANDGYVNSGEATVTITVNSINEPPEVIDVPVLTPLGIIGLVGVLGIISVVRIKRRL